MIIRKLPYTVRSGSAFLMQMDPSVEDSISSAPPVLPRRRTMT